MLGFWVVDYLDDLVDLGVIWFGVTYVCWVCMVVLWIACVGSGCYDVVIGVAVCFALVSVVLCGSVGELIVVISV